MTKILVVEDDEKLAVELRQVLLENGYEAEVIVGFDDTVGEIGRSDADLVLLDVNIPRINGQQVLKKVREKSKVPVIVLTSRSSELDEVVSMSYGADDFVRKPYNVQVLLLRIEAVLGRANGEQGEVMKYKSVEIDLGKSTLKNGESEVVLSKNELVILSFLMKNNGKIVARAEIMDYLWDGDRFVDDNTLTVNINRLRQKLESVGLKDLIQTRRAQGYILE